MLSPQFSLILGWRKVLIVSFWYKTSRRRLTWMDLIQIFKRLLKSLLFLLWRFLKSFFLLVLYVIDKSHCVLQSYHYYITMSRRPVNPARRFDDNGSIPFVGSVQSKTRSSPLLSIGLLVVVTSTSILYFLICVFFIFVNFFLCQEFF